MTLNITKRPAPINGELYDQFIMEVGRRFGIKDGVVKEALEDAIKDWLVKSTNTQQITEQVPAN